MSKAHAALVLLILFLTPALISHANAQQNINSQCEAVVNRAGQDTPSTVPQLCSLVEAGRLDDLRWPDCSSYRDQIRRFYLPSNYALVWTQQGQPTPQARAMIELFRAAERKGLEAEDYDASRWAARLNDLTADPQRGEALARFDFALTVSALRYISDLTRGRINPKDCEIELPAKQFDAAQFIRSEVVNASDVAAGVQRVEPQFEGYRRALAALERYLILAKDGDSKQLPGFKGSLHPGDIYAGVSELAQRLKQLGDLPVDVPEPAAQVYQGQLVAAVTQFQRRHGLQPDGVIGPTTMTQLEVPLADRVTQIKLALERWRWLPHNLDSRVLVVNIPEFRMRAYDNHRLALAMPAIVGKSMGHQTPVFADEMESIVFRPYWNVPESIQAKELVPRLRRDPGYLVRSKMEVVNAREEIVATSVTPAVLSQLASGKLRIRQQPGPANSLGLLKFVFPNNFGVYMHGTPEHSLFFQPRRDFSHGCIRIQDPPALAAWVLRDRPEWTEARISAAMSGKQSISVRLSAPIPVLILYGTVFVEENGEVHFFQDIYGHDATLKKVLAAGRH